MRLPLALSAMLLAVPAFAADMPDLVGTWTPQESASARVGVSAEFDAPIETPALNAPDSAWTIRIDAQDGRAFHGESTGPNGRTQAFVGVFAPDGTSFHAATKNGTAEGTMTDAGFELCWTDTLPDMVAVDCSAYAK
jgi:hypothetical protein